MKYLWTANSDDGCFEDKSEKAFDTQEECYMDMMNHAVNKMKWNVEYSDVMEDQHLIDDNGLIRTDEKSMQGGYIGYEARFYPHKIVHTSYSGTYTYEIKKRQDAKTFFPQGGTGEGSMTMKAAFFLTRAAALSSMALHDGFIEDIPPLQKEDTNAHRKARKERARMLTRQREEELRALRLSQKNAG